MLKSFQYFIFLYKNITFLHTHKSFLSSAEIQAEIRFHFANLFWYQLTKVSFGGFSTLVNSYVSSVSMICNISNV